MILTQLAERYGFAMPQLAAASATLQRGMAAGYGNSDIAYFREALVHVPKAPPIGEGDEEPTI
jgi:hypothetical protein